MFKIIFTTVICTVVAFSAKFAIEALMAFDIVKALGIENLL